MEDSGLGVLLGIVFISLLFFAIGFGGGLDEGDKLVYKEYYSAKESCIGGEIRIKEDGERIDFECVIKEE